MSSDATEAEHLAGTAMIEMRYRTMLAMALDSKVMTVEAQ